MLTLLAIIGTILLVVFFLGLCIFIHEFGHLVVALWLGLHVERFSIGFGRKLWGFWRRDVEFIISVLPFGGYVALPQLDPTEAPSDRDGNPLPQASPAARMATAFAGPAANVIFGFLLASLLWAVGLERPVPVDSYEVFEVAAESPEFAAGLRPGDVITGLNGNGVPDSWQGMIENIVLGPRQVTLAVKRGEDTVEITYEQMKGGKDVEGLGVPFFRIVQPVVAAAVSVDAPAGRAGIQVGDRFLSVNGQRVMDQIGFVESIRETEGGPVTVEVERGNSKLVFADLIPKPFTSEGETFYIIGVGPGYPHTLLHVSPWEQFREVLTRTGKTLAALINRHSLVSPKHMSGPLGIVGMNYVMIRDRGWREGLSFVVLVTFSLAMLNLLPIPVLDGGHILFGVVELVIRRRIPTRLAYGLQTVFAVLLISFILYVSFFDVKRYARFFLPAEDSEEQNGDQIEQITAPEVPTGDAMESAPLGETGNGQANQ